MLTNCGIAVGFEPQLYPSFMHSYCPEGGRFPDKERVFGLDLGSGARPAGPGLQGTLPTEMGYLTEAKMLYFHGDSLRCVGRQFFLNS